MARQTAGGAVYIGELRYAGLVEAAAAAVAGDTLVLHADISLDGTLVLDKAVTLTTDGMQRTIYLTGSGDGLCLQAGCTLAGSPEAPLVIDGGGRRRDGALLRLCSKAVSGRYLAVRGGCATGCGGGIYAAAGSNSRIEYSEITGNCAAVGGGGFVAADGELYLHRCTIRDNRAETVGGAFRVEGKLLPTDCTIHGNTAADPAGKGELLAQLPAFDGFFRGCTDGDGTQTAIWQTGTQGDRYDSYARKLTAAGFVRLWENRIDGNTFASFGGKGLTVTVMDTPTLQGGTIRIVVDEGEPPQLDTAAGEAVAEPLAVLPGVGSATKQNGAALIFRLQDGRFIVIDGGYTEDAQQLYHSMKELAPGGTIRIAAWVLTHAHSDHLEAFLAFWQEPYAKEVVLEKVLINLPGDAVFAQNMVERPANTAWKTRMADCLAGICPSPQIIRAHPGQILRLGGAELTVLCTAELLAPREIWSFNDTSLICRLRFNGTDFLLLGDCAVLGGETMLALYDAALRCHVLQAAHHGHYNNAPHPALYEKAGAQHTLWCSTLMRYLWSENRSAPANHRLFEQEKQGKMTIWCAGDMVRTFTVANGTLRLKDGQSRVHHQHVRSEEHMDIRLVGLDLDGTLLDDDRKVRRRTIDALQLAADKGVNLAIISGRNYLAVPEEIRSLPFIRYFVLCNGAGIYDKWNDKLLFQADIPLEQALELYSQLAEEDVYYDCYLSDGAWTQQDHYDRIDEFVPVESHRAFLKVNRKPFPDLCQALRQRGKSLWKVQSIYKDTATRDREMARLAEKFPQYTFVTAYPYNLEINMPAATKGQGLMQLAQILQLDRSQVMAFGDGGNDVTMLQSAGVGVAMGNACDEAKAAAACIGPTNNEDGVAQVLEALVCGEEQVRAVCTFR